MRSWQRIWSSCTITAIWILSSVGITWAQELELSKLKPNQGSSTVSPTAPVYLMPYNTNLITDGMNQHRIDPLAHYSHRSHSSHYSHRSHSSHYSSSTGGGYSGGGSTTSGSTVVVFDKMDIKTLQSKLNELGYDCGTADGIKGERTVEAIKLFQTHYGLDIDGIVGDNTKKTLDGLSLVSFQRKLKELGYNCDTYGTRDNKTIEALTKFQGDYGLNQDAVITYETKQRLDSISILDVQKRLIQLGYRCTPNGVRDNMTVMAIVGFQRSNGIEPNGIINKQTRDALNL